MDRAISLDARRIDLSMEPPFRLGMARIDPPAHEVTAGDRVQRMQPQALKVLVALHDKAGEVVTRDQLVDRCWDGRVVGDDVLNRCISLLRRFAAEHGGFRIDTVPRAGYRLVETAPAVASGAGPLPAALERPPLSKWRIGVAAAVVVLAMATAGLFAFERLDRTMPDAVMVEPFEVAGNESLTRTFAAGVSDGVESALSAAGVNIVDPGGSPWSKKAAFVLGGRAELLGSDLSLTAGLSDARDQTVLWSTSFTRPASRAQPMQEQVAANLAAVLQCALETSRQPGGDGLDQGTIKLYLQACALEQAVDPPTARIEILLNQVTARQPRFAGAWARLALSAADAAFEASPSEAVALRTRARSAAQTALRLDPRSGLAHEALTNMKLGHVPFAQLHGDFQQVLAFDPNDPDILNDDGELVLRMGREDDALDMFRRGVEFDPLSPAQALDLVTGLIDDSHGVEARTTLQRALRIWPDDNHLRVAQLAFEARFGDPDTALAILNDPDARPENVRDVTLEAYRRLAIARKAGQGPGAREFVEWLKKEVASGQLGVDFAAPHLAQFGDVDDAFRLAFAAPPDIIAIDPEFLWEPEALPLRRDRRFIALANKFYVAAFWRSTGLWPDFCSTPDWPYNCKAQAAHLPLNAWPKALATRR